MEEEEEKWEGGGGRQGEMRKRYGGRAPGRGIGKENEKKEEEQIEGNGVYVRGVGDSL